MPEPAFITFEILTYLMFAACLWHAARQGKTRVFELVASLVYGVLLEWLTIQQIEAYHYGKFLVIFDGAPLCIGLGWAVIIYSGMEFVKNIAMPDFARPFLVGLLALNLDAGMDAVAIRLGFWNWVIPLDMQWFGVPYGNFWAWYIVVTSYSGLIYWFRAKGWHTARQALKNWVYAPLALIGSIVILLASNYSFVTLLGRSDLGTALAMVMLLLLGAIVIFVTRPAFIPLKKIDWVVFGVPLVFHLLFNLFAIIDGIYYRQPILAVIGLLMFIVGMAVHLWPFAGLRRKPGVAGEALDGESLRS